MNIDEKYMFRCIELAKKGLGSTAPNPMVGCTIVHQKKIIGEGYTSPYGGSHAEVNAIAAVEDKLLLKEATLYVTLEPCAHFGKTPPCVNLILEHKIARVVIGLKDPNSKVAGRGIRLLKDAGCKVTLGVLENQCKEHHKRFLTFQEKQRPYIILKWAESLDGFIAPSSQVREDNPKPYWITNTYSKQLVHQWRAEEQAILVGTTTAITDNPKLTTRNWEGENPIRVVIDKDLKIPSNYYVFDKAVKTIVITAITDENKYLKGVTYTPAKFKNLPAEICEILYEHQINSLLLEGGTKTLQSFIDANLWDEARLFKGTTLFSVGTKGPKISGKLLYKKELLKDSLTVLKND